MSNKFKDIFNELIRIDEMALPDSELINKLQVTGDAEKDAEELAKIAKELNKTIGKPRETQWESMKSQIKQEAGVKREVQEEYTKVLKKLLRFFGGDDAKAKDYYQKVLTLASKKEDVKRNETRGRKVGSFKEKDMETGEIKGKGTEKKTKIIQSKYDQIEEIKNSLEMSVSAGKSRLRKMKQSGKV